MKSIKRLSNNFSKSNPNYSTNSNNSEAEKITLDQTFDQKEDIKIQDDKSEKSPNIVEQQICALCGKLTSSFVKVYIIRKSYYRCA